jgi:TonB family protein
VRVGGSVKPPVKVKNVTPEYSQDALQVGLEGVVIIEAKIDTDGRVAEAKVLSGPGPLRKGAVSAVKQWRFTPTLLEGQPVPVIMTVTSSFSLPAPWHLELKHLVAGLRHEDDEVREAAARALGYIKTRSTRRDELDRATKALTKATEDRSERVRKAAADALVRMTGSPEVAPPSLPPPAPATIDAVRPGGGVSAAIPLHQPKPQYTDRALKAEVQGEVWLDCVVLPDGTVGQVTVVRSLDPDLDAEAISAAKRWRFEPGTRNGEPVPVLVTIAMTFSLRK